MDTVETADLEEALAPSLDLPRALFRGRYSGAAVARMEAIGLPVDTVYLDCLLENWDRIKRHYIARDDVFGLYEDTSFREGRLLRSDYRPGLGLAAYRSMVDPSCKRKTLRTTGQSVTRSLKPLVRLRGT